MGMMNSSKIQHQTLSKNCTELVQDKTQPPSSPDVNPLDYGVWGYMKARARKTRHPSKDTLKNAVEEERTSVPKAYIKKVKVLSGSVWRPRSR